MKFSAIPEDTKIKLIEVGSPIILQCVVTDPAAQVCWYKDEMKLISSSGLEIQSVGNTRTLVIQSAELSHSGLYRCTTQDDIVEFQVEIKGDFTLLFLSVDIVTTTSNLKVPLTTPCLRIMWFDGCFIHTTEQNC